MIVLKANQDKVLAALQSVAGIVERRHTLPILANVLIRKTGGQLQLTTSDLEIQIRTTAELGGDEGDFTTTIGARKLIDILRTMPADQTVSLESSASSSPNSTSNCTCWNKRSRADACLSLQIQRDLSKDNSGDSSGTNRLLSTGESRSRNLCALARQHESAPAHSQPATASACRQSGKSPCPQRGAPLIYYY